MKLDTISDTKKLNYFSNSIFELCKNMTKKTMILALSWESAEDKLILLRVVRDLKKSHFIEFTSGFNSIKVTLTSYGQLRVNRYQGWYDEK